MLKKTKIIMQNQQKKAKFHVVLQKTFLNFKL